MHLTCATLKRTFITRFVTNSRINNGRGKLRDQNVRIYFILVCIPLTLHQSEDTVDQT